MRCTMAILGAEKTSLSFCSTGPIITLRASCDTVYCNRSCLWVCPWVCYHDKSKLHALILTKLGLWVKIVTISSWLNFGRPASPGRGSVAGLNFWLRLTARPTEVCKSACSVCISSERFFHYYYYYYYYYYCMNVETWVTLNSVLQQGYN